VIIAQVKVEQFLPVQLNSPFQLLEDQRSESLVILTQESKSILGQADHFQDTVQFLYPQNTLTMIGGNWGKGKEDRPLRQIRDWKMTLKKLKNNERRVSGLDERRRIVRNEGEPTCKEESVIPVKFHNPKLNRHLQSQIRGEECTEVAQFLWSEILHNLPKWSLIRWE